VVSQLGRSGGARTMDAAEDLTFLLHPMADDPAATVRTSWREPLNRAFEAIENMALPDDRDFKRPVVVISANLTFSHL